MFRNKNRSVSRFFRSQGFYLALIICVAVLGISAIAIFASDDTGGTGNEGVDVQNQVAPNLSDEIAASESAASSVSPSPTVSVSPSPSASIETQSPKPASVDTQAATLTLTMPLKGTVIQKYSGDSFVFNPTLNQWRTHNGVDIAPEGNSTDVMAALAGKVEKIETDENKGVIITLAHSDKQYTIYTGLEEASVKEGDEVTAGQTIGKVGTPAFEADSGAHLHFEFLKAGNYVDPTDYFKN